MPRVKISEYSTTNSANTDIQSINIDEGCAPSNINNAIRELMVHLKNFQTGASGDPLTVAGTFVASSSATINGTTIPASKTLADTDSAQTFTNKLLTNPTVTNYVETLYAPAAGSAFTVSLSNGTVQKFTSNANITITLPSSVAGKSFVILVEYGGTHTLTWAGGGTLKWASATAPVATSANGKIDIFTFFQDGTNTYGSSFGRNF